MVFKGKGKARISGTNSTWSLRVRRGSGWTVWAIKKAHLQHPASRGRIRFAAQTQ
ncbi:hypothetical protein ZHAS_00019898 [Anopheles sinensis]|uniref:Uncharacterized protein n=1 Tax=Anopheles sinensis TaxID=74873 RepID=A0A084WMH6_ANOSI|nr:hypothetical protein ZHAS_00019898 [Anopheles sinensis]